jgi:hypothetical protein
MTIFGNFVNIRFSWTFSTKKKVPFFQNDFSLDLHFWILNIFEYPILAKEYGMNYGITWNIIRK